MGLSKRGIDRHRRLSLPSAWLPDEPEIWLLCPGHLIPSHPDYSPSWLYLFPATPNRLMTILPQLPGGAGWTASLALYLLRREAERRSLPPLIATSIRVRSDLTRFTLTPPQKAWLGYRGLHVVLLGMGDIAIMLSPKSWARWHSETRKLLKAENSKGISYLSVPSTES